MAIPPTSTSLIRLKCIFRQLIVKDECLKARNHFFQLYDYIKGQESDHKQLWYSVICGLRIGINKQAIKRHKMLIIPYNLL